MVARPSAPVYLNRIGCNSSAQSGIGDKIGYEAHMEPAFVAVIIFTLLGLFAIALIADKKQADSERDTVSG